MILQSLVKLYEDLARRGEIAPDGWSSVKTAYAVCLDLDGNITQLIPLFKEEQRGKRTVLVPQSHILPAPVTKSSGKVSNFIWENANYLLGLPKDDSEKEKAEAFARFEVCRKLHHDLLDTCNSSAAKAILNYFDSWDLSAVGQHPAVCDLKEELQKGINLTFRINGIFAYEAPDIRSTWEKHYFESSGEMMQCLVTGEIGPVEAIHPKIKGVKDAQSSGASLVSFNADAFCSYNRKQNINAPVGKYASFAYTAALNHLLADRNSVQHIGDTTVVCWAEGAEPQYSGFSCAALFGQEDRSELSLNDLRATVARLADGLPVEELGLMPDKQFYILGLSPNASRLSVRFFLRNTFGSFMKNINEHHKRMEIARPSFDKYETIPLWKMLGETVNPNSRDKAASPLLAGSVARAIFTGGMYPAALIENVMLRIKAEQDIGRGKAAIIKAYYLRNQNEGCPKEVLTVSLNENSTNIAYNLGRMFSVLEEIQQKANPGISSTIKDKYFNSASSVPATIFPVLNNLCQKHLRKLNDRDRIYLSRKLGEITDKLDEEYPSRLTLPQQGSFYLGYYHQTQKRFVKKEEN